MKKFLFTLLLIIISFWALANVKCAPIAPVRTMEVPYASPGPFIDGSVDACYGELQTTNIFNATGYEGSTDFEASFRVCWDMEYFYIYCRVIDDIDHSYIFGIGNSWEFDHAQVYFQLDTNMGTTSYSPTTVQLRFCRGLDAVNTYGRADPDDYIYYMEGAAAGGWLFEVAIPWTCVLETGSTNEDIADYIDNTIGFDLDVADSDNYDGDPSQGNRDVQAAWDEDDPSDPDDRTEDLAWVNTSVFGYITLSEGTSSPRPIANAGPNQIVDENAEVTLDGTGSFDPEGGTINYTWNAPPPISLSNIHSPAPSFIAPEVTSSTLYSISLTVDNGTSISSPDYVSIYVVNENKAPVANAGPNQIANEGGLVMLDGELSYDIEGTSLSYSWSSDWDVDIVNANSANPLLVAPDVLKDETVNFILTVNDGLVNSEPDTMNLLVKALDDEGGNIIVYDTTWVIQIEPVYNTILISVVDSDGDLIAREVEGTLYVKLYPNPADQYIRVSSEMLINEVQIINISGGIVTQETVNALEAELNLGDLTAGSYILRLDMESGIVNKQFVLE